MKSHFIVGIVVLLLALAGGALGQSNSAQSNSAPAGAPKLVMAQTDFSFGTIKAGEVLNHTFVFKNEGTADLEIKNVAPS